MTAEPTASAEERSAQASGTTPPNWSAGTREDAIRVLAAWPPPDAAQDRLRREFLAHLGEHPDGARRSCVPGHVTASAVVLDATLSRTLLTLHPRVGFWVPLGGHCEDGDQTLLAAATREATEESGIAGLRLDPDPVYLDRHPVTCSLGVPTEHLDVCYVAVAPPSAVEVRSDESLELRWWDVSALPEPDLGNLGPPVAEAVRRARRAEAARADG